MAKTPKKRKVRSDKIAFTNDQVIEMRALAGVGYTVENLAEYFGVSKATMDRRIAEDDQIQEALRVGRSRAQAKIYKSAYNMASHDNKHGDFKKWYMGARYGWSAKDNQNQVNVQVNVSPEQEFIREVGDMSTEDLAEFVDQGRKKIG